MTYANAANRPDQSDNEKPDLVSLAQDIDVPNTEKPEPTWWTLDDGTSMAAPIVTGLAAMLRDYCAHQSIQLSALETRAILMNAGRAKNIVDGAYSTPGTTDWKDGAGAPTAPAAKAHCDPSSIDEEHAGFGSLDIKYGEGEEMPDGDVEHLPGPFTEAIRPRSGVGPGPGDGRRSNVAMEADLDPGSRFRFVLTYNACVDGSVTSLAGDLDVFLFNESTNSYIAASQSVFSVNEGFDVVIPSGQGGHYKVIVGHTRNPSCPDITEEPTSWSVWYRRP